LENKFLKSAWLVDILCLSVSDKFKKLSMINPSWYKFDSPQIWSKREESKSIASTSRSQINKVIGITNDSHDQSKFIKMFIASIKSNKIDKLNHF
jgi:hypothetical protein